MKRELMVHMTASPEFAFEVGKARPSGDTSSNQSATSAM